MRYLDIGCRLAIGIVFLVAVTGKVSSRSAFAAFVSSLRQMGVVREPLVRPAARASVSVEAAIVVLLAIPLRAAGAVGFALAGGLLAVFMVAIRASIRRGNRAPCRCFGPSSAPLSSRHLVRNAVLIGIAVLGFVTVIRPSQASVGGGIVAAGGGLVVGLLLTAFDDIAELVRPVRASSGRCP